MLSGRVPIQSLDRISPAEGLSEDVKFELRGMLDKHGRGKLQLAVSGVFSFTCQRCLGPFSWNLDSRAEFLLVSGNQQFEMDGVEDECETIPVARQMSVEELIEDQIILEMPMIPRHEMCSPPSRSN